MPAKTNAARLLDGLGIRYELREYEFDPDDLSAETVATKVDSHPSRSSRRWPHVATEVVSAWR